MLASNASSVVVESQPLNLIGNQHVFPQPLCNSLLLYNKALDHVLILNISRIKKVVI